MKPALQLRIGQQLTMTPQLQQAIRLLQLPLIELNTQLQQALAENVMLELVDPGDLPGADPAAAEATYADDAPAPAGGAEESLDAGGDSVIAGDDPNLWGESTGSPWSGEGGERPEAADTSHESLRDHLLWQLEMDDFGARERLLGEAIIDAINETGYLTEALPDILATLDTGAGFTEAELEATLAKIQAMDPAGVGARDLAECLRLQLQLLDADQPGRALAIEIVDGSLELLAGQEYAMLRHRHCVSQQDLDAALALVRSCHPKPGLAIQPSSTEYVIPDVYVRRRDGRWVVDINRSMSPRIRVNQAYADMVRGDSDHAVLRGQLQEARWLVRSLEIRNDTLLRVAMSIVDRQAAFLAEGEEAMRPMVLRDIATSLGMHESTISRVTAGKYMHTPRGVFEFRHFFSSHVAAGDGGAESSTAVRARIRRLIGQENPAKPLSDSEIAALLAGEGVHVARRTVAKYREAMNIEPSGARRKKPGR